MEYKPSEIAEEIGISLTTIYRNYLPAGCPHRREKSGQIWIHGKSFAAWARAINELNKAQKSIGLEENQAWCVRCNQVVTMQDPHERHIKRNLVMVYGTCEKCAGKVNRLKSGKGEK
jgi:hypothetical protein